MKKKIFFWFFVLTFLLASTFIGMMSYGKYQIEKNCKIKITFSHFKFYAYSSPFSDDKLICLIFAYKVLGDINKFYNSYENWSLEFQQKRIPKILFVYWSPIHNDAYPFE